MKYTFFGPLLVVAACSTALYACASSDAGEPTPQTTEKALTLTGHTPTLLEGTFVDANANLSFKSVESAPRKVDLTVRAGATELRFHLDFARGEGDFDAHSGRLDAEQIAAMPRVIDALSKELPDENTLAADALGRTLNLLGAAPASETLRTFKFVSENGWAHLPCSCGVRSIGGGRRARVGKGETCGSQPAPHCPGRCGVGCGPDNLVARWGSGVYTVDCARHDYGIGTWEAAFDDYSFAPKNCP
ncbi:hypothetical protein LZC95_27630 [Pendulispora brunnea]|uniref:Lipoprotein n=1 Tax=Pendulispora brunnea TaxID=2905690 RepID=A0ABZ2JV32_9BACT